MEDDQVLDAIKKLDARRLHEEPHEENTIKYPKEIYKDINGKEMTNPERLWGEGMNRRHAYYLGHEAGYAKCLAEQADPLAGYSNLTAAISAGEPIDYEKLDGLNVKCVNPDVGKLRGVLVRNRRLKPDTSDAWWGESETASYINALYDGWKGNDGWSLWVEGEVPLRRKTAEQLPLGMCFEGEYHNSRIELAQVIANRYGKRLVTDHEEKNIGGYAEEEVEVVKEYGIGTFQKPEGK